MGKYNEQLCWSCKNAYAGKCPWFTRYEPVENWTATPTIVKVHRPDSEDIPSFEILVCPEFDIDDNSKGEIQAIFLRNDKNYDKLTRFEQHIIEQLLKAPTSHIAKKYGLSSHYINCRLKNIKNKLTIMNGKCNLEERKVKRRA